MLLHNLTGSTAKHVGDEQAVARIEQLAVNIITSAEAGGRVGRMIRALILRSLALNAGGLGARAQADLGNAITLAAPGGYVRVFSAQGEPMARLLGSFGAPPAQQAYVRRLLEATSLAAKAQKPTAGDAKWGQAGALTQALVEPLSEREIEVLKLLAEGLTYQEVAERLIVSLNTVRFHVKSIYGKLGVDNKTAALEAARNLRLW
jgi:LuxR family maltose regulon positive regulatory protein